MKEHQKILTDIQNTQPESTTQEAMIQTEQSVSGMLTP